MNFKWQVVVLGAVGILAGALPSEAAAATRGWMVDVSGEATMERHSGNACGVGGLGTGYFAGRYKTTFRARSFFIPRQRTRFMPNRFLPRRQRTRSRPPGRYVRVRKLSPKPGRYPLHGAEATQSAEERWGVPAPCGPGSPPPPQQHRCAQTVTTTLSPTRNQLYVGDAHRAGYDHQVMRGNPRFRGGVRMDIVGRGDSRLKFPNFFHHCNPEFADPDFHDMAFKNPKEIADPLDSFVPLSRWTRGRSGTIVVPIKVQIWPPESPPPYYDAGYAGSASWTLTVSWRKVGR